MKGSHSSLLQLTPTISTCKLRKRRWRPSPNESRGRMQRQVLGMSLPLQHHDLGLNATAIASYRCCECSPRNHEIHHKAEQCLSGNVVIIPLPEAIHIVTPKDEVSEVSQAFVAPVPVALVHALCVGKRPPRHMTRQSPRLVRVRHLLESASVRRSRWYQLSPVPLHNPVLTRVRRPSGLMATDLEENMFCKPEEGVRPTRGVKGNLARILGLRTKSTEPPRPPIETCMPSQPAQTSKSYRI
ncbi:hypothetical protein DFH29DRAFT_1083395 [Suillus ampliporus]|nr:hypothetical protein DFH29DRAFT_1083395 [Suillus ampliporus]